MQSPTDNNHLQLLRPSSFAHGYGFIFTVELFIIKY
jgi:hypothetical protein